MRTPATVRLTKYRVAGTKNKYVVGFRPGHRATAYAQGLRATDFAHAFIRSGRFHADTSIAVVGAGMCGVNLAYILAAGGFKVALFDSRHHILSAFKGSTGRFLHPGIYDWPSAEAYTDTVGRLYEDNLIEPPYLSWHADYADGVRIQIVDALENDPVWTDNVSLRVDHRIEGLTERKDGKMTLRFERRRAETFDVCVICPGVGVEKCPADQSYWRTYHFRGHRLFIVGCGDGGATDAVRYIFDCTERELVKCIKTTWPVREKQAVSKLIEDHRADYGQFGRRDLLVRKLQTNIPDLVTALREINSEPRGKVFIVDKSKNPLASNLTFLNLLLLVATQRAFPKHLKFVTGNFSPELDPPFRDNQGDVVKQSQKNTELYWLNLMLEKDRSQTDVLLRFGVETSGIAATFDISDKENESFGEPIYVPTYKG